MNSRPFEHSPSDDANTPRFALSPDILLVLRAFAVADENAEVDQVAAALGLDAARVLERLQSAADGGVPIDDDGVGHVRLPDSLRAALRSSVLPSLAAAWRSRLAPGAKPPSAPVAPTTAATPVADPDPPVRHEPPRIRITRRERPPMPVANASKPAPASPDTREAAAAFASGDLDKTVAKLLDAARVAASNGASEDAANDARNALALLVEAPASDARRILRATAMAELGRIQGRLAGPAPEFTLPRALETLRAGYDLLVPADSASLRVHLASTMAECLIEIGTEDALHAALAVLGDATRSLLTANHATDAARLLDDAAAVHMRLGAFPQAQALVSQAREAFASKPGEEAEIAAIELLMARLTLHAPVAMGGERAAIESGLRHAKAAEALFDRLANERDRARAWESIGRLELRGGRLDSGGELLWRALDVQESVADAIGLARTTEALAEALATSGRYAEAVAVLADSISLNLEKASPIGIAFDRQVLRAIAVRSGGSISPGSLNNVVHQLESAEALLGRIDPGETHRPIVPRRMQPTA